MSISPSKHILELARELVDDVELSRLGPEQLLLKAARLARLTDDQQAATWLRYELRGYMNDADSRAWMIYFGRLEKSDSTMGYFQPLAGITGAIAAMQTQIQQLNVPNIQFAPSSSNPHELVTGFAGATAQGVTKPAADVLVRLQNLQTAIVSMSGIRSRVLATIHEFVMGVYYERELSGVAESIFDRHKTAIDQMLLASAPDAVKKIPSIYDRLAAGDAEATSQALNSVRRMIKAFADAVNPAQDGQVEVEGQTYEVGTDKVLNRIKVYLATRCASKSRCERLNKNLRQIYERAAAGSHSDVTTEEAQALFLQTYLALGEMLAAKDSGNVQLSAGSAAAPIADRGNAEQHSS